MSSKIKFCNYRLSWIISKFFYNTQIKKLKESYEKDLAGYDEALLECKDHLIDTLNEKSELVMQLQDVEAKLKNTEAKLQSALGWLDYYQAEADYLSDRLAVVESKYKNLVESQSKEL